MISDAQWRRRGLWGFWLATAGCLWAIGLIVAAVVVPAYSGGGESAGSNGATHTWSTSSTLVQTNGAGILFVVAVPAVISIAVWLVLHWRAHHGGYWTFPVATALVMLLALGTLVAIMSIGMFVVPVVVLLAVGARTAPDLRARPT